MARYLLDTDAIIDYLFGIPAAVSLFRDLHQRGDLLCVCDVVIAEVYAGLRPQDQGKAGKLLDACLFLPTSADAAKQAGIWRYTYARRGMTISIADALIAATAQAHQATIVTGNAKDYPAEEVSMFPLPLMPLVSALTCYLTPSATFISSSRVIPRPAIVQTLLASRR